jgi:hypothetical protein
MKAPISRQGYCYGLHRLLQRRTSFKVIFPEFSISTHLQIPEFTRNFTIAYTAWLDILAGVRHRKNMLLAINQQPILPHNDPNLGQNPLPNQPSMHPLQNIQMETLSSQQSQNDWRLDWRNPEPLSIRCPVCFGVDFAGKKAERAVVIIDGNFSQKRQSRSSILHRNKRADHRLFVTANSHLKYMNKVSSFL